MSDTTASLRRKIDSARDLQSVVRTMKALAASSIGQYEKSVSALADYYRTVELGLGACFRESGPAAPTVQRERPTDAGAIGAVVFGSDQGLVGQFNEVVADFAMKTLAALPGKPEVWAVGERVHARLADAGLPLVGLFAVPSSVEGITPLVGRIQIESEAHRARGEYSARIRLPQPPAGRGALRARRPTVVAAGRAMATEPGRSPLADPQPARSHRAPAPRPFAPWSANTSSSRSSGRAPNLSRARTRAAWRRCNAPTRTSMSLLESLNGTFHRLRQSGIDEELFDVISGFEALSIEARKLPSPNPGALGTL